MTIDFSNLPRVPLATLPTPLTEARGLRGALGGEARCPRILLKRDDLTAFSWGGNKVRTLEYILGDALAERADTIVVAGGPTSNFAALLAVAATVPVVQVCYGQPRGGAAALALSTRAGARVEFTGSADRSSMDEHAAELATKLRAEGRHPYVVPRGGATPRIRPAPAPRSRAAAAARPDGGRGRRGGREAPLARAR